MINPRINHYINRHEIVLERLVREAAIEAPRIKEAMLYTLFPGGKRLRPLLVYLVGELVDVAPNCLDFIAAAIELTHCYSLVHDDLPAMDNDDLRRGKPSCHKAFDEATAILVGDGMQALALDILLTHLPSLLPPTQVIAVAHELVRASGPAGMVSGQSLDLSELTNPTLREPQLRKIHALKTGKLILACINTVLAASHSSYDLSNALRTYAKHLGLVFQIQDDYLDHYESPNLLGKGRASDRANQKLTFTHFYNKEDLLKLINTQFQQAKDVLTPWSQKTNHLLALTHDLHMRNL